MSENVIRITLSLEAVFINQGASCYTSPMDVESFANDPQAKQPLRWRDPFLWMGIIAFIAYLVIGLSIVRTYGMAYDEVFERMTGLVNTKFILSFLHPTSPLLTGEVFRDVPALAAYGDRFYGSWFSQLAVVTSHLLGDQGVLAQFQTMHILVFLVSCLGIASTYAAIWILTRSSWAATAVMLLSMTIPRFFAERFYNSKDMILLAAVELAAPWIVLSLRHFRWPWTVMAGVTTGLAIATRLSGMGALFAVLGVLLLLVITSPRQWKKILSTALLYALASGASTILFFPFLWSRNPVARFIEAFQKFQNEYGFFSILYQGEIISNANLPLLYVPQWIFLTLPLPILALGLVAVFVFLTRFFSKKFRERIQQHRVELVFFGIFVGPIIAVMVLGTPLYDGWRHVYFLMAGAYVVLGSILASLSSWITRRYSSRALWLPSALVVIVVGLSVKSIVSFHPYENMYFNEMAPRPYVGNYDGDYWGLSYREGLEYILAHDERPSISIAWMGTDLQAQFIDNPTGKIVTIAPRTEVPDYFLTNYRYHPEPYDLGAPWYSIKRNGETILDVFKIDPATSVDKLGF